VYDMYPWNEPDSADRGDDPSIPPRSEEGSPPPQAPLGGNPSPQAPLGEDPSPQAPLGGDLSPQAPLVRAVQVALDRRDNGGDAVAVAGQPTTQPPVGRTRQ
jgi:hypothetical protein